MAELELEPDTCTLGSKLFPSQHTLLKFKWNKIKKNKKRSFDLSSVDSFVYFLEMFNKSGCGQIRGGLPCWPWGHWLLQQKNSCYFSPFFLSADGETEAAPDQLSIAASGSDTSLDSGHGNLSLPGCGGVYVQ